MLTTADADLWLVSLEGAPPAIHLTHQVTLDRLGLDDRISTGRVDLPGDPLLRMGHELADALYDWWAGTPPPIVYRSRSVPSSRSIAFGAGAGLTPVVARPLVEAKTLLADLVLRHGFDIPSHWLLA